MGNIDMNLLFYITDVCIEPELQPVDRFTPRYATANVEDHARVDVRAKGFWSSRHKVHFLT